MKAIRTIFLLLVACTMVTSASHADSVSYLILGPTGLADCTFSDGPGSYTVIATLDLSSPAKAMEVSAPQRCGAGFGIDWNFPVSGDPNTVLTVDFEGCIAGSVQLYTAQFDVFVGCCPALLNGPVTAGPEQTSPPVLIGCDDVRRYLIPPCSASQPQLLTPADGATGVSLTPFMSWDYEYGDYCEEGIGLAIFTIHYGVDPGNLDHSYLALDAHQGTLPMLEPETQYFWRVRVLDDWAYYSGAIINYSVIRSFTTAGAIPIERTTWGAVKALYQD